MKAILFVQFLLLLVVNGCITYTTAFICNETADNVTLKYHDQGQNTVLPLRRQNKVNIPLNTRFSIYDGKQTMEFQPLYTILGQERSFTVWDAKYGFALLPGCVIHAMDYHYGRFQISRDPNLKLLPSISDDASE